MRTFTAMLYYFAAVGAAVALINLSVEHSMRLGGIALISYLLFNLISVAE